MITKITVTYPPRYTSFKRKDENQRHVYGDRYIDEALSELSNIASNLFRIAEFSKYVRESPNVTTIDPVKMFFEKVETKEVNKKKRLHYVPNAIITEEDI